MRAHEAKGKDVDPTASRLARIFASLAVWAITYVTSLSLLTRGTPSGRIRAAAVAIGVGGLLPWVWTAARSIASEDEFTRRVHYIALSCTFAATGVFLFTVDLLTRAHFIGYLSYMHVWMFMVTAWLLSIVLTTRYYR
jgi:hypothetical protein